MVGLSIGLDFLNEKLAEPMKVLEGPPAVARSLSIRSLTLGKVPRLGLARCQQRQGPSQ